MLWTIGQFPELDHLDPRERAKLLRRVPWWTYPQLVLVALVVGGGVAGAAAVVADDAVGVRSAAAASAVAGAPAASAVYLLLLRRVRIEMRREIAAGFLGERPPFCFGCGYDLRAFGDDRCPECGRLIPSGAGAVRRRDVRQR